MEIIRRRNYGDSALTSTERGDVAPNSKRRAGRSETLPRAYVRQAQTAGQLVTVQGSITVRPAASNARVSRDATVNPWAAAIAAI